MTSIEQKMKEAILGEVDPILSDMTNVDQAAAKAAEVAMDSFADCIQWAGQNGWECPFFKDALWYHATHPTCNSKELFALYLSEQKGVQ